MVSWGREEGLPNIKSMVYAIPALTTDTAIKLFGDFKVFTEAELVSRAEVKFENYAKDHQHRSKDHDRHGKQTDHPGSHQICDFPGWIHQHHHRSRCYGSWCTEESAERGQVHCLRETQKALDELIAIENAGCEMEDGEAKAKYYYEKVAPAEGHSVHRLTNWK